MNKHTLQGMLQALLFTIPVPLCLVVSSLILPIQAAFALSFALAIVLIRIFAWPNLRA